MSQRQKSKPSGVASTTVGQSGAQSATSGSAKKGLPYNPHSSGAGPAAKIWELLRRNPAFRYQAGELVSASGVTGRNAQETQRIARVLQQIDSQNPIAGYVLHWIFEPEFLDPRGLPHLAPPNINRSLADFVQSVLPHVSDQEAQKIAENGLPKLCAEFPFYLRRDLHVFQRSEHGTESSVNPILGALWDERQRGSYPGKLGFDSGPFSLESAWPQTPPIFQSQFRWLWARYDENVVSPFTGDRAYFPSARPVNWLLDQIEDTPNSYERLDVYRRSHLLFGVPLNSLYSERRLNEIVRTFESQLRGQLLPFIGPARLGSTPKYPNFLGRELEWEVLAFCYPLLDYTHTLGNPRQPQRLPLRAAIKSYASWRRQRGKRGKEEAQAEENYKRMEFLMTAVYPEFDLESLIRTSLLEEHDHIEGAIKEWIPQPPHVHW